MTTKAKQEQRKVFDPVPQGSHVARLYRLIHIGTVSFEYGGEVKELYKIRLEFEFPNETKEFKEGEGEKPYSLGMDVTLSMHEKSKLRPIVEGIIGVALRDTEAYAFDIEELIGKECMVTVKHKEKKDGNGKYAFIDGVVPVPKGMKVPKQVNASKILNYDDWKQEVFDELPQWIQEKIQETPEYKKKFGLEGDEITSEDIPFP